MRVFDEGLRDAAVEARQSDVQASGEGEVSLREAQVDFGVDDGIGGEVEFTLVRDVFDGGQETGGPAGSEELLRVGAGARTRGGEFHIEMAVIGAGSAAVAAAGGVGLGGVEKLVDMGDRGLWSLSGSGHGGSLSGARLADGSATRAVSPLVHLMQKYDVQMQKKRTTQLAVARAEAGVG